MVHSYAFHAHSPKLWAFAVAFLGVFFAVPLRKRLLIKDRLRFPSGTATAETIQSMFASGEDATRRAKVLGIWALVVCRTFRCVLTGQSAAYTVLIFFIPIIEHPPLLEAIKLGGVAELGFGLFVDPMLYGGGVLAGFPAAWSMFAGSVVGWGIIGTIARQNHWAPAPVMV